MKISTYLSAVSQYLFSVALIALTTLLFFALRDLLDTTIIALTLRIASQGSARTSSATAAGSPPCSSSGSR